MATLIPSDTRAAIGSDAGKCNSRSLLLDRFADPSAMKEDRKKVFARVRDQNADAVKSSSWGMFVRETLHTRGAAVFCAQLQSRLMVNMAGGVMENAGLCLDRFGMPYLPGSAVKGCARRAALAGLREKCEGEVGDSGDGRRPTEDAAVRLSEIARVFGWCEQDWAEGTREGLFVSDFAWACGGDFTEIWAATCARLREKFGWTVADKNCERPWKDLPNFAGSVSFLPAYPVDLGRVGVVEGFTLRVPKTGELELDVLTCHHRRYYQGDREFSRPDHLAPDTEEPVPIVFPAVAPGHVFAFSVLPMRNATPELMGRAAGWLKEGMTIYGIGAKTAAGYGWFDASDGIQSVVEREIRALDTRLRTEADKQAREEAEKSARAEAEARRRLEKDREKALSKLPPDEQAKARVEVMSEEQFFPGHVEKLGDPKADLSEAERRAIVEALRASHLAVWEDIKSRAAAGGKKSKRWSLLEQAIRAENNRLKLGKMP